MAYTTNPHAAKARGDAVRMVKLRGFTQAQAARHFGVAQSTISKWLAKAPRDLRSNIPTESSRPKHSPKALEAEMVEKILEARIRSKDRCAPIVHQMLLNEGVNVSLSTVKRTLKREGYVKEKSPWKRFRPHIHRPLALFPGALVQTDTIHFVDPYTEKRYYVYTAIDLYSRKAFAMHTERINTWNSYEFVREAEKYFGFTISCLQADNGPEFGRWLTDQLKTKGITLRHSRVRKPNDNAHIERFNRTLKEEAGLDRYIPQEELPKVLSRYLKYYNCARLHLSIGLITPEERVKNLSKVLT